MTPFVRLTSLAVPLLRDNVDTDAIIPSREMTAVAKTGLADGLFAGWRYTRIGGREPEPGFVLNAPALADARILIGGRNFGCGSSREHAVWALAEYGFRAIVAPSFNPIFRANCVRNGILPVEMDGRALAEFVGPIAIDLPAQTVSGGGVTWTFTIDDEAKTMLLEGLDPIALTLKSSAEIARFIAHDRAARNWAYLDGTAA
jgi:3-isopropylmalate/(R)-2-methylmalate dehydratase small subunit